MTPRVPEEGRLCANSRGLGPPYGSGTSPRSSGPPTRVKPIYRRGGVRGRHVSRRRGRESSVGRLAHPPHSMRVVEACSVVAARGAAFVRPHCRPHITKVHSAAACAACAASAQSPSAALNGYDGMALFHHVAYAASYTAVQLHGRQRRKLPPGAVSTRQGMAMPDGRFPQAEQRNPGMRSPSPAMP